MTSIPVPTTETKPLDAFTARLTAWQVEQDAFLASIPEWTHEAADMPSLDSAYVTAYDSAYYEVQEGEATIQLGNKDVADAKYYEDLDAGGYVYLACYGNGK